MQRNKQTIQRTSLFENQSQNEKIHQKVGMNSNKLSKNNVARISNNHENVPKFSLGKDTLPLHVKQNGKILTRGHVSHRCLQNNKNSTVLGGEGEK